MKKIITGIAALVLMICCLILITHIKQSKIENRKMRLPPFPLFLVPEREEEGEGKDVGGVGGDESIEAAAGGLEHADILQRVAGPQTAEDILETQHREAVGKKETESYARQHP